MHTAQCRLFMVGYNLTEYPEGGGLTRPIALEIRIPCLLAPGYSASKTVHSDSGTHHLPVHACICLQLPKLPPQNIHLHLHINVLSITTEQSIFSYQVDYKVLYTFRLYITFLNKPNSHPMSRQKLDPAKPRSTIDLINTSPFCLP